MLAPHVWRCRALRADGSTAWFASVVGDTHPDGTVLELPEPEAAARLAGEQVLASVELDGAGLAVRLDLLPALLERTGPLWFVHVPEPDADPAATNLVAFTGGKVPAGSVLQGSIPADAGARSADQLGAIRWWPGTGEVDQVYVAPARRRSGLSTALMAAAGTLATAGGSVPLWGDGQRTALGERMKQASPWSHRFAELEHLAPPMTPFDER
ncbi:MAG: GNAT family N-acetyltransferase [Aeromicrobium erythreum]